MAAVGQQATAGAPPPITQLEFHQAMRDFRTMFPEMEGDVIEAVLRANGGAVDATIDQLLTMSMDNENERLRAELDATENAELPPRYSPATPPPSYHQATVVPPLLASETEAVTSAEAAAASPSHSLSQPASLDNHPDDVPLSSIRKWQPALLGTLPADFLRVTTPKKMSDNVGVLSSTLLQHRLAENERQRQSISDDPETAQYLEDERVALFLQNAEFMEELRTNPEFISTLEKDYGEMVQKKKSPKSNKGDQGADEEETHTKDPYAYSQTLSAEDSEAAFREKLKNMGKVSRRKFAQLARLFSRRKRPTFRPILGDGTNPSRDNLLLNDDYSELSGEDSEGELYKKDSWNSHGGGSSRSSTHHN